MSWACSQNGGRPRPYLPTRGHHTMSPATNAADHFSFWCALLNSSLKCIRLFDRYCYFPCFARHKPNIIYITAAAAMCAENGIRMHKYACKRRTHKIQTNKWKKKKMKHENKVKIPVHLIELALAFFFHFFFFFFVVWFTELAKARHAIA